MERQRVSAIVPALNEEKTIGKVLSVLKESGLFQEIIVVDGASTDKTAQISEQMGVKVIRSKTREGKGMAMKMGMQATSAKIIAFFDADLINLNKDHVFQVVDPVLKDEVVMNTGERGRWMYLPYIISKIDPLLAIGGERAMRREVLEKIPQEFIGNFAIETALNYYCKANKLKTSLVALDKLDIVPKEIKWGIMRGFSERIWEVFQIIKIRLIIVFCKNEFMQKNDI